MGYVWPSFAGGDKDACRSRRAKIHTNPLTFQPERRDRPAPDISRLTHSVSESSFNDKTPLKWLRKVHRTHTHTHTHTQMVLSLKEDVYHLITEPVMEITITYIWSPGCSRIQLGKKIPPFVPFAFNIRLQPPVQIVRSSSNFQNEMLLSCSLHRVMSDNLIRSEMETGMESHRHSSSKTHSILFWNKHGKNKHTRKIFMTANVKAVNGRGSPRQRRYLPMDEDVPPFPSSPAIR